MAHDQFQRDVRGLCCLSGWHIGFGLRTRKSGRRVTRTDMMRAQLLKTGQLPRRFNRVIRITVRRACWVLGDWAPYLRVSFQNFLSLKRPRATGPVSSPAAAAPPDPAPPPGPASDPGASS